MTSTPPTLSAAVSGTTGIARSAVGFTLTYELSVVPNGDVRRPDLLVDATPTGTESVTFSGPSPGPDTGAAIAAALRGWLAGRVRSSLDSALRRARERRRGHGDVPVPRAVAGDGGAGDRAGVRTPAGVGTGQVGIFPVLADYNLVTTVFPAPSGSGSRCPSTALVHAGLASVDLAVLRGWRDQRLCTSRLGRMALAANDQHGPEVCSLLCRHAVAAGIAARALEDGERVLRGRAASAPGALRGAVRLARALRPYASPSLARALTPPRVLALGAALAVRGIVDGHRGRL